MSDDYKSSPPRKTPGEVRAFEDKLIKNAGYFGFDDPTLPDEQEPCPTCKGCGFIVEFLPVTEGSQLFNAIQNQRNINETEAVSKRNPNRAKK